MDGVIVDNDILIKLSCYNLSMEAFALLISHGCVASLVVTRLIVAKQIQRSSRINDKALAIEELNRLLSVLTALEPTEQELTLAADLEAAALFAGLPFDGGESQILAVAILREISLIVTGDKRAIAAATKVLAAAKAPPHHGKVACLEQVILGVLVEHGLPYVRKRICREPRVDRALSTVFSCSSTAPVGEAAQAGLESYICHLRAASPELLHSSDELSVVT